MNTDADLWGDTIISEASLPKIQHTVDGKRVWRVDYSTALREELAGTKIQVAKCLGAWLYRLGSDQHDTEMNREKAKHKQDKQPSAAADEE